MADSANEPVKDLPASRDSAGRFLPGNSLGPGRKKKPRPDAAPYLQVVEQEITTEKWAEVVRTALGQAVEGDADARNFLASYVCPPKTCGFEPPGKDDGKDGRSIPTRKDAEAVAALINRLLAQKASVLETYEPAEAAVIDGGEIVDIEARPAGPNGDDH